MSPLIKFLLKEKIYFFIIGVISSLIAVEFGGFWKIIPYIFLLFFFYEWNVFSKINKTWTYVETLPISLLKRYFLRVIFPFMFCFVILFFLEIFKRSEGADYTKAFIDSSRQTSVFLLSSILASSLSGYILWMIMLNFIMLILSFFHFYIIFVLVFIFGFSYYIVSKKRASRAKFFHFPLLFGLFVLSFGNILRVPIYTIGLSIPLKSIQTYSAQSLIDGNAFIKLPWSFLNGFSKSGVYENYNYDDQLLQKIERIVVHGETCPLYCYELAKKVAGFPHEWNLERLSNYLNSKEDGKQIYALEIFQSATSVVFFNRIMQLAQSENPDVSSRALIILNNWGIHSHYDIPNTQVF